MLMPEGEGQALPPQVELYYALSECYKEPWEGLAKDVASGTLRCVVEKGFAALGIAFDLESLQIRGPVTEVYARLKRDYYPLFMMPPHHMLPVESVYKDWGGEGGFLAGMRDMIMGPPAVDMFRRFQERDIAIPETFTHYPDHMALLLEYAGLLCSEGDNKELVGFVASHLDGWVEEFAEQVKRRSENGFYHTVVLATVTFVQAERKRLLKGFQERQDLPVAKEERGTNG